MLYGFAIATHCPLQMQWFAIGRLTSPPARVMYTHNVPYVHDQEAMLRRRNGNGHHDKSLESLIDLYLLRCQVEGKSPNTTHAYAETLLRFLHITREEGFPEDVARIEPAHLYTYLGRFTCLSAETRHRYFREVHCFFNWLVAAGYLGENPFRSLRNVRLPHRIVRPFSSEEVVKLLACCNASTAVSARDRAILLVLLDTGVRCSELVQLTLDGLDLKAGRLNVLHAKGNKQRVVPFASRCREALQHYLGFRGSEPGPLYLAAGGHRTLRPGVALRPDGLKQLLRRLGRQAGIHKVHAHRFRHTFAAWAIGHDARELDVQYVLGHSSPDTWSAATLPPTARSGRWKRMRRSARWSLSEDCGHSGRLDS
jgi:site-specific recombinase XerD